MSQLLDYSLILLTLAILGFVVKDNFYKYRVDPYELKTGTEKYLSYVSLALLILSYSCIALMIFVSGKNELASSFLVDFVNALVESKLISEESFIEYFKDFVIYSLAFFVFASLFVFIYFISFYLGLISLFFDTHGIEIKLKNEQNDVIFKRIIIETNDFIFLETIESFRKWKALRKEEVEQIKNIRTESKFDRFVIDNSNTFDIKNTFLKNNLRQIATFVPFFLITLSTFFVVLFEINLFYYTFAVGSILILIVILIDTSLKKKMN